MPRTLQLAAAAVVASAAMSVLLPSRAALPLKLTLIVDSSSALSYVSPYAPKVTEHGIPLFGNWLVLQRLRRLSLLLCSFVAITYSREFI